MDKENLKSKLLLNDYPNQSQMQINLNGNRIHPVSGIEKLQNTSEEPVTPVTKNGYPLSRMTYVDAVQKGMNISK